MSQSQPPADLIEWSGRPDPFIIAAAVLNALKHRGQMLCWIYADKPRDAAHKVNWSFGWIEQIVRDYFLA